MTVYLYIEINIALPIYQVSLLERADFKHSMMRR